MKTRLKKSIKAELLFVFCVLIMIMACGSNPSSSNDDEILIYGTVQDTNGNALTDVGVHFILVNWRNLGKQSCPNTTDDEKPIVNVPENFQLRQNYPNPFNPSTRIDFTLSEQAHVDLIVYNYPEYELVDTLISGYKPTGHYAVTWNGHNDLEQLMTNGFYPYRFITENFTDEKTMCIQMLDPESLANSLPKFVSNSKGRFQIPAGHLPVGKEIPFTSEVGDSLGVLIVPDSITIVLTKTGYASLEEKIKIDINRSINMSFIMESK